mgnify:CR=1 FL=1|jgi:Mrp family chromosome partitioning ATPase
MSDNTKDANEKLNKQDFIVKTNELNNIKKVIGIVSGKGGVGKSIVTSLVATIMNKKGFNVGILDADITGPSIPKAFGINGMIESNELGMFPATSKNGIKIVSTNLLLENESDTIIWRGPLIANLVKQFWTDVIWGNIDYLFIDMPPGTGDVPLTIFQSIPLSGIIIVTSPQDLVSMIVSKAVNMANKMSIPILGIIENMSYVMCPKCGEKINIFGDSNINKVAKTNNLNLLGKMPISSKLALSCDNGNIENFEEKWLKEIEDKIICFLK